jgi:RNA recognition motif-containing protein
VTKNLYVGNLNYDTTEDTLRTLFSEFGEIESAKVITDQYTGRSRGFGFVEMGTEEAAQAAIGGLNGREVDGRQIKVDKAKPRRSRDRSQHDWGGSRW